MDQRRTVTDVLSDLASELTMLFRKEMRLARTEVSENIAVLGAAAGLIAGGAALGLGGLILLLQAVVAWLVSTGFSVVAASLMVAVVVLLLAAVLVWVGLNRLKAQRLAPTKTVEQLQRDAALARHKVTSL
jgi:uncharacterized membrane protein YqjE